MKNIKNSCINLDVFQLLENQKKILRLREKESKQIYLAINRKCVIINNININKNTIQIFNNKFDIQR